jgi:hypothetical protein
MAQVTNKMNQLTVSHINDMLQRQFQVATTAHNHRFLGDFNHLLDYQLRTFRIDEFKDFIDRFQRYQLKDDKNLNIEELRTFLKLLTDTFKYDALFLSKDQIPSDHPILKIQGLPIISENEFMAALENIEKTKMVRVNRVSLIFHCLLHLRTKFLSTLSPNFYLQYINNTQAKSKRDRVSPEFMKSETATMADRSIRENIEVEMQGVFGYGPSVWNDIIKVTSPKKNGLQLPNYAALIGTRPIQINKTAKKVTVYESMLPLIRLLSPDYPILTFDQWCEREENDPHLATYRNQYLIRRVLMFDRSGILFKVDD